VRTQKRGFQEEMKMEVWRHGRCFSMDTEHTAIFCMYILLSQWGAQGWGQLPALLALFS